MFLEMKFEKCVSNFMDVTGQAMGFVIFVINFLFTVVGPINEYFFLPFYLALNKV